MDLAKWRIPRLFKGDPNLVYAEIKGISDKPNAQDILNWAREHEDSELHKCFEWDNDIAGEKWRLQQARQITIHLVINQPKEEEKAPVRLFVKTDNEPNSGYKPIQVVVKNEDEHQKLLERAYAELRAFKVKYATLQELDFILEIIPD